MIEILSIALLLFLLGFWIVYSRYMIKDLKRSKERMEESHEKFMEYYKKLLEEEDGD